MRAARAVRGLVALALAFNGFGLTLDLTACIEPLVDLSCETPVEPEPAEPVLQQPAPAAPQEQAPP
ncbi:MAG TPA: hypothetical protein VN200_01245, partial [Rhodoglobus sp.]|nr:hypothetical protein [Rhodoglobus sp.]